MRRQTRHAVQAGALAAIAAVLAAAALPGAAAESAAPANASVTRAVLLQGNADASDIQRSTLITQIQVDGQGQVAFAVPTVPGSSPSNLDTFGAPAVDNGAAVYDVPVDGADTFRTSQDFDPAKVPVELVITATLDGRPVELPDLRNATGDVVLTYTAKNTTSTPTTLTYLDAAGTTITETVDMSTAMGGTLDIVFPPSWSDVTSKDATVVSGDGTGNTQLNASWTLFEPFGQPSGSVVIAARANHADMPPANLKFTVLQPQQNPTARSLSAQLQGGADQGKAIYEGGTELAAGATQLQDGLVVASEGASQIAQGVSGTLVPGVNALNGGVQQELVPGVQSLVSALQNLPATASSSPQFQQLLAGFGALDGAIGGVGDALGTYSATGPGQYLTPSGEVDTARTTAARTLWSLIYGVRSADVPASSPNSVPAEVTGGLTNPACNPADPTNPGNPCGAWQVVAGVNGGLGRISSGLGQAQGAIDGQINPGIQQVQGGLTAAQGVVTGAGATAWAQLAAVLGCQVAPAGTLNGNTGPIVVGCATPIMVGGTDVSANVAALAQGLTGGLYAGPNPDPSKNGLAVLLGAFAAGLGQASDGLGQVSGGLGQSVTGLGQASGALQSLQRVVTSDPTGAPDPKNPAGATTATGTLNQLRAALAQGGTGSNGVPGTCQGYATPGDPSSGLNPAATPQQITATCAAADVLNVAQLVAGQLEAGVSQQLLQGISDQLVGGVAPLVAGVDNLAAGTDQLAAGVAPLAFGTQQLADGLPAAVAGAGKIVTDAAQPLQQQGNQAAVNYGRQVALYTAMNNQDLVNASIPGGAATGDSVRTNGVYSFELAGTSSESTSTGVKYGLGLLALLAAAGVAAWLAVRQSRVG